MRLTISDQIFNVMADERVQNWAFMQTPYPTIMMLSAWIFAVYGFLPFYMKDRKPFNLKTIIMCYNVFQVTACLFFINAVISCGWTTQYLFCQPADYSDNPEAVRLLSWFYWFYWLKAIELVETIFFRLRKKDNQVSFLHVYHHSSTLIIAWLSCKYMGGGVSSTIMLLNSFIHVLMYSYYFIASLGPEFQQKVAKWKSFLTTLQMVQFGIFFITTCAVTAPSCQVRYKEVWMVIFFPNIFINFYMFYQFYQRSYKTKPVSNKS